MATVVNGQVKLNDGKLITPQQGGWYDGQQYWAGSLSAPGQIHPQSNQQGAGQLVSKEVNAQSAAKQGVSAPQFEDYLAKQRAAYQPSGGGSYSGGSLGLPSGGGGGGGGIGFSSPEVPNFPDIYKSLYESSGINKLQEQVTQKEAQYLEARNKISDNPFLDASTMDKRLKRLAGIYEQETKPVQDKIAMQRADVETQLNLKMKQFDIESQAAQQALSKFNTLLAMGALDGASGEDIAAITRTTGISSGMIQSAIAANNKKNNPVNVSTFTAENGEVFAVAIDSNGNMINKQSLGVIGNVQKGKGGSGGGSANYKTQFVSDANSMYGSADIFPTLVQNYAPYMSLQDIYRLYATTDPGKYYGTPAEDKAQISEWYNVNRGK